VAYAWTRQNDEGVGVRERTPQEGGCLADHR
jgi:hypothetical protein